MSFIDALRLGQQLDEEHLFNMNNYKRYYMSIEFQIPDILPAGCYVSLADTLDTLWQIAEYDITRSEYLIVSCNCSPQEMRKVAKDGFTLLSTAKEIALLIEFQTTFNPRRSPNKVPKKKVKRREGQTIRPASALATRIKALMPEGVPRYIRCYDNQGASIDRYTVCFTGHYLHKTDRNFISLGMSDDPTHPQGVGLTGEHRERIDFPSYRHLGTSIQFEQLPEACKKLVIERYVYLWDLTPELDRIVKAGINAKRRVKVDRRFKTNKISNEV